ncbi:MAG: N,N-dimethylformamidase beta subunit family domain-containing protein [Candidatus Nitrosocosmicus sp.]
MKNMKSYFLGLILILGIILGRATVYTDRNVPFTFSLSYSKLQSPSLLQSPVPSSAYSYTLNNLLQTKSSNSISSILDLDKIKIGFVKPIFTDAAYNNKFYIFYSRYARIPHGVNITKDLSLLNSKVSFSNTQNGTIKNVFALFSLIKSIKGLSNNSQVYGLSDLDVDKGNIFFNVDNQNPINLYDILVLGHQEYVTQKEYDNLKQFVLNGGKMILLDGNIFYAEVKYNNNNNTISLVKGHGWAYNGKTALRSVDERWKDETSQWVGSNYLCYLCVKSFEDDPFGYLPHEEQYITNPNDKIIFNYNPVESSNAPSLKSKVSIDAYSLNYGRGKVISFGIYSDDVIQNSNFIKFFDKIIMNTL